MISTQTPFLVPSKSNSTSETSCFTWGHFLKSVILWMSGLLSLTRKQLFHSPLSFSFFYFYNIVLVLPYINMNPPQVYTCSLFSLLPPCTIPLGHPSAPAPSIQYYASNLDWRLVSQLLKPLLQLCLTLCDPMEWDPQGSSILGISQARILE